KLSAFPTNPISIILVIAIYNFDNLFFFSSSRRHTRFSRDWSSDVCSSDLEEIRWTFLDDLLEGKEKITKSEVQQWIDLNQLDIQIGRASCRERVSIKVNALFIKMI